MKTLPNNGLTGDFVPCEEGILQEMNHNFLLIDSIMQLRVIDFVETLPNDPDEGDIYILETPSYSVTDNSIMVFNGSNWLNIPARSGYEAYVESLQEFYVFNGSEWALSPRTDGDVKGPNSSLTNSIAIFDNATGKFISDSDITIESRNTIMGVYHLESESIVSNKVGLTISEEPSSSDELPAPNTVIKRVTSTSLIKNISAPAGGYSDFHIYINETGGNLVLENNANIRTGTGSNLSLKKEASVIMVYGRDTNQWFIVGGSGSGGGLLVVADLPALYAISEADRTNGMLVQVVSEDQIYKLIGLPAGATTTDADWDAVITSKAAQVITNKDIDGGTASDTSRITVPSNTLLNLKELTRKEASLTYNTDAKQMMLDGGSLAELKPIPKFDDLDVFFQSKATTDSLDNFTSNLSNISGMFTTSLNAKLGLCFRLMLTNVQAGVLGSYSVIRDIHVPNKFRGQRVQLSFDYISNVDVGGVNLLVRNGVNEFLIDEGSSQSELPITGEVAKKIVYVNVPYDCETLRLYFAKGNDSLVSISNKDFYFTDIEMKKYQMIINPIRPAIGTIEEFAGPVANIPYGFLHCNGAAVSRSTYAKLFTVIGTTYGVGDGSTTFNLPDSRGIGLRGAGSQTFGGVTYNATLGQKRNDAIQGHHHDTIRLSSGGGAARFNVVASDRGGSSAEGPSYIRATTLVSDGTNGTPRVDTQTHGADLAVVHMICFDDGPARYADYTLNQDISTYAHRNGVDQVLNVNNGEIKILLNSIATDSAGKGWDTILAWDTTNSRYVSKVSGRFRMYGLITAAPVNVLAVQHRAMVKVNSVNVISGQFVTPMAGSNFGMVFDGAVELKVGDIVELYLTTTGNYSTNNLTINGGSGSTYLIIERPATSQQLFAPIAQRYVVKTYQSGTSWYEVNNDGWVRQGSTITDAAADGTFVRTYLIEFKDTNYTLMVSANPSQNTSSTGDRGYVSARTTTNFTFVASGQWNDPTVRVRSHIVEGYGNAAAVRALGANPQY